jgi:hypothetical protein
MSDQKDDAAVNRPRVCDATAVNRPHCEHPDNCAAATPNTHCRPCACRALGRSASHRAKVSAGVRAMFKDPEKSAARREAARQNIQGAWLKSCRIKGGRTRSEKMLGWCPLEYRDEYGRLRGELGAAEAKRIITDQIKRDAARYAASGALQRTGLA